MNNRYRMWAVAAVLVLLAAPAYAQEYTIHNTMLMKFGGPMGFAMRIGGGGKEMSQVAYLSGHKMRSETGDLATIIDADEGRITNINNKDKSYTTMTFEEMAAMMKAGQAQMQSQMKKSDNGDIELKYSAKVETPGETQKIAGYDARHVIMILQAEASGKPEGKQSMEEAGTIAIVVDTWNAKDVPGAKAMKEFQEAMQKKAGEEFGSMRGMEALFGMYPGAKEGLAQAAKEMKKAEGYPVRTTTYAVLVAPGQTLNRDLVFASGSKPAASADKPAEEKKEEPKKSGGMFGKLKAKIAASMPDTTGGAESGRGGQASQSTVFSVTSELKDVQAGGVPADAWTIPAGYKEKKMKQ